MAANAWLPDGWVRELETLLGQSIGFDPSSIGEESFHESIRVAYLESGFDEPLDFVAAVRDDDERRQALIARVVVPETWFLRDEAPFTYLQQHAMEWARRNPSGVLRVLSAPCASGEEPYSIAMTLLDAGLPPDRFMVDAVDVSEPLLARARRGLYHGAAFRRCPPVTKARYFTSCGEGFFVTAALRARVQFTRCNLVGPHVQLPSPPYDVVFCRNLLIYLHEAARSDLIGVLCDALDDNGVLIAGHAETLPIARSGLFVVADSRAFALVKPASVVRESQARRSRQTDYDPVAPPLSLTAAALMSAPRVGAIEDDLLDHARVLADQTRFDEARRICERLIKEKGPSADIYFLLGVIDHADGRYPESAEALRKALYLNPCHRDALLQLAIEHERRGDAESALRLRRRASRAPAAAASRSKDEARG